MKVWTLICVHILLSHHDEWIRPAAEPRRHQYRKQFITSSSSVYCSDTQNSYHGCVFTSLLIPPRVNSTCCMFLKLSLPPVTQSSESSAYLCWPGPSWSSLWRLAWWDTSRRHLFRWHFAEMGLFLWELLQEAWIHTDRQKRMADKIMRSYQSFFMP